MKNNLSGKIFGSEIEATEMLDEVYMVVNDVSLTYRTCMELMLDNSRLIKNVLFSDTDCNSMFFRFMPDGIELVCTICEDRKRTPFEYDEFCRGKSYPLHYTTKNKVAQEGDDIVFLLSVGFISDNFLLYPSVLDLVEEHEPGTVRLSRSKIESLCRM